MAQSISRQTSAARQTATGARPARIQTGHTRTIAAALCLAASLFFTVAASPQPPAPADNSKSTTHITPEQAKKLFSLVDELLKFSSEESGLPVKSAVKRQLTTRNAVESYLTEKFKDDQDAKRLERDEIVLKKFGLLDRDFDLKPFLLALLKEQIEAYYDSKTKTVNMLDWVDVEEQKPVLAHELTHALQDQHSDLEKWDDQTPEDVSTNQSGDNEHLAKDEMDTARDAVAEGQATAVMMDYILKPAGKSLVKDPEVMDVLKQQMTGSDNSPVMARAPLLLSESLLFPYRDGLSFEQDLWMDQGQGAAFAKVLDTPPTSSWEIINPREYEQHHIPAVPLLPDIHPLVDKLYQPYDIGQIGQLDVRIITELFGGDQAARSLTPAWNGGLYWAGQLRNPKTPADLGTTKSLALFYLAAWRNTTSAHAFAKLYADSLGRKYSGLKVDNEAKASAPDDGKLQEQVFSTTEGPVVVSTRGKLVFIAESFPLDIARKLTAIILDAQGTGEMKMANTVSPVVASPSRKESAGAPGLASETWDSPSGNLVRFLSNCGVMKFAVDAGIKSGSLLR